MPVVVLDTNILVAALLRGGGSARRVLRACLREMYLPVLGPAPLANFDARVRFETRAARGNPKRALALLDKLDRAG